MGMIDVKILDISGSKVRTVEAPDNIVVERLLVLLVEKMKLPLHSPDGQIMSYKLHHRRSGRQLLSRETFQDADVRDGDELRIQPEITAGIARKSLSKPPPSEPKDQIRTPCLLGIPER